MKPKTEILLTRRGISPSNHGRPFQDGRLSVLTGDAPVVARHGARQSYGVRALRGSE
jgi:hypothetical protein